MGHDIKLLALDLDGTLLTSDHRVTERTRRALDQARERSVRICVVTGRRYHSSAPLARRAGADAPLVLLNGALVKDLDTGQVLRYRELPMGLVTEVVREAEARELGVLASDSPHGVGRIVYSLSFPDSSEIARYIEEEIRSYYGSDENFLQDEDLARFPFAHPLEIRVSGPLEEMAAWAPELARLVEGGAELTPVLPYDRGAGVIGVKTPGTCKSSGLAFLDERLGVAREEIMALGDAWNDVDMLEYAGLGVLMGNAAAHLKEIGLPVTAPNDEDGVAKAVERFILGES